jgi:hypothetical protein
VAVDDFGHHHYRDRLLNLELNPVPVDPGHRRMIMCVMMMNRRTNIGRIGYVPRHTDRSMKFSVMMRHRYFL